jgi:hypothetical protein
MATPILRITIITVVQDMMIIIHIVPISTVFMGLIQDLDTIHHVIQVITTIPGIMVHLSPSTCIGVDITHITVILTTVEVTGPVITTDIMMGIMTVQVDIIPTVIMDMEAITATVLQGVEPIMVTTHPIQPEVQAMGIMKAVQGLLTEQHHAVHRQQVHIQVHARTQQVISPTHLPGQGQEEVQRQGI